MTDDDKRSERADMVTFVVTRTSQSGLTTDTKPCEGAYKGTREITEQWAYKPHGPAEVWLIDVADLQSLLDLIDDDRVILDRWSDNRQHWEIEFYDDYRE